MGHYFLPSELISTILGFLTIKEQRRLNEVSSRLQPLVLYWVNIKNDQIIRTLQESLITKDTEIRALQSSCAAKDLHYDQLKSDFSRLLEDKRIQDIRISQLEQENREKDSQYNRLLGDFTKVQRELHELKQKFQGQANYTLASPHTYKVSGAQNSNAPGSVRKRSGQEVDIFRKKSKEEDKSSSAYEITRLLPFYSGLDPEVAHVTIWTAQKAFELIRRKISYLNLPVPEEGLNRLKIVTSNTQLDSYELNSSLCTSFDFIIDIKCHIHLPTSEVRRVVYRGRKKRRQYPEEVSKRIPSCV